MPLLVRPAPAVIGYCTRTLASNPTGKLSHNPKHHSVFSYLHSWAKKWLRPFSCVALVFVLNLSLSTGLAKANPRLTFSSTELDSDQTLHIFRMDAISRPSDLRFPVVIYLAMDHPGIINVMQQVKNRQIVPTAKIDLPLYLGYLVVTNNNHYTFVSRVDSLPAVKNYVTNIILQQQEKRQNGMLCSSEPPTFCASKDSWSAVWVLLNDFYRKGVYVAAYTAGQEANNSFVPNFRGGRSEEQQLASVLFPKEWPEFSNNLLGMKAFNRQAYNLPIFAQWWYGMNAKQSLGPGQVPSSMYFPLVYYFSLTSQGVHKFAARGGGLQRDEEKTLNFSSPLYAGYLVVDEDYTYLFTRKCPFPISLPALINVENSLKAGDPSESEGLFNMSISAPARSWNGLGVFLARIVSSGDYEIFAYTAGKPAIYNFEPLPVLARSVNFKDNINRFSYLYENEALLNHYKHEGVSQFNSILFHEFGWPDQWAKGATAPHRASPWE